MSEAVNGNVFAAYPDQVFSPTLVPGDVVVLDNLLANKVTGLSERIGACGARLSYLPPYYPNFNPIELTFNKRKTWLRTGQARTREAREIDIQDACDWITELAAENWFDHCGYHVHYPEIWPSASPDE